MEELGRQCNGASKLVWNISLPSTLIMLRASLEWLLICPDLQGLSLLVRFWVHSVGEWLCFPPAQLKRACPRQCLPELALDSVSYVAFITIISMRGIPLVSKFSPCSPVIYIASFLYATASSVLCT